MDEGVREEKEKNREVESEKEARRERECNSEETLAYRESIRYVQDLCRFGMNMGLERTRLLLDLAGAPDRNFFVIHVAGTNGKGSTSAMLLSGLSGAGFSTGLYTSPHLDTYRERIRIGNQLISEGDFARHVKVLRELIERHREEIPGEPTEFEFLTVLAATWLAEQKVDFAVFEAGLGGRLDSTNALETNLAVITNIGLDHQDILGDTVEAIAREKGAIIRPRQRVAIGVQEFPAAEAILYEIICRQEADFCAAKDRPFGDSPLLGENRDTDTQQGVAQKGTVPKWANQLANPSPALSLRGRHQLENYRTVLCVLDLLVKTHQIDRDRFLAGVARTEWPGRLEYFSIRGREVILDGAHNPQGARVLREYLEEWEKDRRIHWVVGILDDKDKAGIWRELYPLACRVIVSRPAGNRSAHWDSLPADLESMTPASRQHQAKPEILFFEDPAAALEEALSADPDNPKADKDLVLICGSFYLIGEIRKILLDFQETPTYQDEKTML